MGFAADDRLWTFLKNSALPYFGVALFLIVGVWLVATIRNRYRGREDHAADPEVMLMQFRELQREGDLTEEEYRSIKSRLIKGAGGSAPRKPPGDETSGSPESEST